LICLASRCAVDHIVASLAGIDLTIRGVGTRSCDARLRVGYLAACGAHCVGAGIGTRTGRTGILALVAHCTLLTRVGLAIHQIVLVRTFCDLLSVTGVAGDFRISVLVIDIGAGDTDSIVRGVTARFGVLARLTARARLASRSFLEELGVAAGAFLLSVHRLDDVLTINLSGVGAISAVDTDAI
jgi:hypothetical protein